MPKLGHFARGLYLFGRGVMKQEAVVTATGK
jgi:hypothetical protein